MTHKTQTKSYLTCKAKTGLGSRLRRGLVHRVQSGHAEAEKPRPISWKLYLLLAQKI